MAKTKQYWHRLIDVIEWLDTTPNHFAIDIGMMRAENIYHIKNLEHGISTEFANRVVNHFPEINLTWLLTGVGNMLAAEANMGINIPYYNEDIIEILPTIEEVKVSGYANLPFTCKCDIIARTTKLDRNEIEHSVQLFLRYVDISQIESNREYILKTHRQVVWCNILSINDNNLQIINNKNNKHQELDSYDITQAWLVTAKLEIN